MPTHRHLRRALVVPLVAALAACALVPAEPVTVVAENIEFTPNGDPTPCRTGLPPDTRQSRRRRPARAEPPDANVRRGARRAMDVPDPGRADQGRIRPPGAGGGTVPADLSRAPEHAGRNQGRLRGRGQEDWSATWLPARSKPRMRRWVPARGSTRRTRPAADSRRGPAPLHGPRGDQPPAGPPPRPGSVMAAGSSSRSTSSAAMPRSSASSRIVRPVRNASLASFAASS